mgnify:CR=1 FL=1
MSNPTLIVTAPPNEANPDGDVFGGWMMSQLDLAGGITASRKAGGRVATVGVKELTFIKPVFVYDVVSFHTEIVKIGKTSITVFIEAHSDRKLGAGEATITYVAIQEPGVKKTLS